MLDKIDVPEELREEYEKLKKEWIRLARGAHFRKDIKRRYAFAKRAEAVKAKANKLLGRVK